MQISDKAVEAAAAGMWHHRPMQRTADGAPVPFSEVKSYQRFRYLDQAHAALEAAAPHILAGAADAAEADELTTAAEVIYDLRGPASRLKCEPVPTMRGDQVIPDEAAATAARAHQELMAKAGYPSWEALMPSGREIQMNRMRAALEAAAPYIISAHLLDLANDTSVRGDIGKEGGVEAWDYLRARADSYRTQEEPHIPSDLEVFVRMFDGFAANLRANNVTDDPHNEGQAEAFTFAARQLRAAINDRSQP